MTTHLRGDEILACVHRISLRRGGPVQPVTEPEGPESQRRRESALAHRSSVFRELAEQHPNAERVVNVTQTLNAMREGTALILSSRLPVDERGQRIATTHALVRVGRHGEQFQYAPLLIKNHEVSEPSRRRSLRRSTLTSLLPTQSEVVEGVGVRSSVSMVRTGVALTHGVLVLREFGFAATHTTVGVIDRQRQLWWFDVGGSDHPRFNVATYERHYQERRDVLKRHDQWLRGDGPYPTTPYWHRECLECEYSSHCADELNQVDDVSLVRFTTAEQQRELRRHGVRTRRALALLDPRRARVEPRTNEGSVTSAESILAQSIDKLPDLIYRARAHSWATPLRTSETEPPHCPTALVEVDIDMESYNDVTYLWGAWVTSRANVPGIDDGYHAFATWEPLSRDVEAINFARFWKWLGMLRDACAQSNVSFAAYCFWAQAEDRAMDRAAEAHRDATMISEEIREFRQLEPPQWIDLHELAKRYIQTEGPLGLKGLARTAGFEWRDENPSGEASMLWYEQATSEDGGHLASMARRRLLAYNEDDCRATRALREWLNGPARELPHRDQIPWFP